MLPDGNTDAFQDSVDVVFGARECHGFANLHGLRSRAGAGTGAGWHFRTPEKPIPVTWV